jgi:hypothetical protein
VGDHAGIPGTVVFSINTTTINHNASPIKASIGYPCYSSDPARKKARIRELREVEEVVGAAIVKRRSESNSDSEDKSDIWKLGATKYFFTPSFIAS